MKRLLPVLIVLCLLATMFTCLPKSVDAKTTYTSLDELNGCKIGIQTGTSYETYLSEKCPDAEPVFFNEYASIYPALQQGKIDLMLSETISFAVEKCEMPTLVALEEPLGTLDLSIAVCKNTRGKAVLQQMNEFILELKSDGTMDQMTDYWFTNYDRGNTTVDKSGITGENGPLTFTAEAAFEPVCFAGTGGELMGFDVDFIYRFCRRYGYTPDIETLSYDAISAALASGKSSVAVGVIPDAERAEELSFTEPFFQFSIIAVYDTGNSADESFWDSLVNSFNKTFIRESRWQMFAQGIVTTLLIAVLSAVFGTIFGLLLYQWCKHGKKAELVFTKILCWIMSSTPTVVLLMILYYVIFGKYIVNNIAVAVGGFTLLFGCSFYELIVSGVKAVGTGQMEAGRAQGFNADQTFFHIIFPQAAEHFMPGYQGAVISLIQETSVVGYIAIMDLTKMSDLIRGRTYEAFFPLIVTACIYFLLIWLMTFVIQKIANRLNTKNRKTDKILKGITFDRNA